MIQLKAFSTNDAFVAALKRTEWNDRQQIKQIMRLDPLGTQTSLRNVIYPCSDHTNLLTTCLFDDQVGVRKLRSFLEARVEDNYK